MSVKSRMYKSSKPTYGNDSNSSNNYYAHSSEHPSNSSLSCADLMVHDVWKRQPFLLDVHQTKYKDENKLTKSRNQRINSLENLTSNRQISCDDMDKRMTIQERIWKFVKSLRGIDDMIRTLINLIGEYNQTKDTLVVRKLSFIKVMTSKCKEENLKSLKVKLDIYAKNIDQLITFEQFKEHAIRVTEQNQLLDEVLLTVASQGNIDKTFKVLHTILTAYISDFLFRQQESSLCRLMIFNAPSCTIVSNELLEFHKSSLQALFAHSVRDQMRAKNQNVSCQLIKLLKEIEIVPTILTIKDAHVLCQILSKHGKSEAIFDQDCFPVFL